jgi:hypothetical protein
MAFDWFDDLADADAYFTGERIITTHWDALSDAQKTKAIIQAYNWIYYSDRFNGNVPTKAQATAAQLVILKKAQGECAYFLAEHLEDMDTRKGLQAQAVTDAGIVKERYDVSKLHELPFPPLVLSFLSAYDKFKKRFAAVEIGRDDDEDVNADLDLNE